jgi:molybdate transport system substrate-binding protein
LTEVFNEVKNVLQAQYAGLYITYNFAGAPTLRTQVEQGARADVLATANEAQMGMAVKAGVIQSTPVLFAANCLVVVTPEDNARVHTLGDLAGPGVKLVLALKDVPAGGYARESLERMGASGEFGHDFPARVLANLVSEEPNVRQVLSKVVLGEADAAIVYRTDITPNVSVRTRQIPIQEHFNVTTLYPIAVVKGTARPAVAEQFIAYLRSPEGRAILTRHGFKEVPK